VFDSLLFQQSKQFNHQQISQNKIILISPAAVLLVYWEGGG
jgi:hypothetical protein